MFRWTHRQGSRVLAVALSLLSACALFSTEGSSGQADQPPPVDRDLEVPDQVYRAVLDNGMTLVVIPDSQAHLIEFDVRHLVGSREDPAHARGMAHLVEHLMFQLPVDGKSSDAATIWDTSTLMGAQFNAVTTPDETHYMYTGAPQQLERYIEMTAARLDFRCEALSEARFLRERSVVQNEYRTRQGGSRKFTEAVFHALFEEGHPYRELGAASDTSVAQIDAEAACAWAKQYYTTKRTHVVVTGPVDPKEVLRLTNEHLAPVERKYSHPRATFPPRAPEQSVSRVEAPIEKARAFLIFPAPTRHDPQYINYLVSTQRAMFGLGDCAHDDDCGIADASIVEWGFKDDPYLAFLIEPEAGVPIERAADEAMQSMGEAFWDQGNPRGHKAVFDLARQSARLSLLRRLADFRMRAYAIADMVEEKEPTWHQGDLDDLDSLFVKQSDAYGRGVFKEKFAKRIYFVPNGEVGTFAEQSDIQGPFGAPHKRGSDLHTKLQEEAKGPLELGKLADRRYLTHVYEADNGLRVVLAPNTDYPVVHARVVVRAGDADTAPLLGPADLAADARELPRNEGRRQSVLNTWLSGTLAFPTHVTSMSSSFQGNGLSIYLDHLLDGLSAWVRGSDRDDTYITRWRESQARSVENPRALGTRQAQNEWRRELFGPAHPLATQSPETTDEVTKIDAGEVSAFRRNYYHAKNTTLVLTGRFRSGQAAPLIRKFFGAPALGKWSAGGRKRKPMPQPATRETSLILSQVDPLRARLSVSATFALLPETIEDYLHTLVGAELLQQAMWGLRAEQAITYGVHAKFKAQWPSVELEGSFDAQNAAAALTGLLAAQEELSDPELFAQYFAIARRRVVAQLLTRASNLDALAEHHADLAGLGLEHFPPEQLARLTAKLAMREQQTFMKKRLATRHPVYFMTGPRAAIEAVEALERRPELRKLTDLPSPQEEAVWGGL